MAGSMYQIENTEDEHASVLKYTMQAWGEKQPDMFLVSTEGVKVYTQRIILNFYSKMIREILGAGDTKEDLVGVSVPASCSSLTMMLKVLVSGSVIGNNKEDLLEIGRAAETLGIMMNDRQIGYRRKSASVSQILVKGNDTETSERKHPYIMSFDSVSDVKTEPSDTAESQANGSSNGDENMDVEVDISWCPTCGKIFSDLGKLKRHMRIHKPEKERPYKCDECGKTFSSTTGLKFHRLLHSGELFRCEFCEYTNVQKGNLKTHRLKVHKEELDKIGVVQEETKRAVGDIEEGSLHLEDSPSLENVQTVQGDAKESPDLEYGSDRDDKLNKIVTD